MKHLPEQAVYLKRLNKVPLYANSIKQGRLTGVGHICWIDFGWIVNLNPQRWGV